jgi:hypothetical protein
MRICALFTLLLAPCFSVGAQEPATSFTVTSAFPKYVTADIEFRDPTGAKWPNFFYGKPANDAGVISLNPATPTASFALLCDKMAQDRGDQSQRVLGELCAPEKSPVVMLTITKMGPVQPVVAKGKDKAGSTAELMGTLDIAGRKFPLKAQTTFRPHEGKGDEKNAALFLEGKFSLKASDLGLKSLAPSAIIEVRFGLSAYPPQGEKKK